MSNENKITIERLNKAIDCFVDLLIAMDSHMACDIMAEEVDENGICWCEQHCGDKLSPDKECWLRYVNMKLSEVEIP